jgi:hypothetical protein
MFCPNCGNADQKVNSYCRNCGTFLPDFDKLKNKEITPQQHLTINSTFSFLSGSISLVLAILFYIYFAGKDETPILMYVMTGFLTANFFWQVQTFWRTLQLKKHLPKRLEDIENISQTPQIQEKYSTDKLLPDADFENIVPVSVTENTTKHLKQKIKSS